MFLHENKVWEEEQGYRRYRVIYIHMEHERKEHIMEPWPRAQERMSNLPCEQRW